MFKKLLKYDLKSIGRIAWIVLVACVALSFIAAVSIRTANTLGDIIDGSSSINIVTGLSSSTLFIVAFLCFIGICIAFSVLQILVYYRFYSNLYTDEGYLTFTLPVKRQTIIDEKIFVMGINAVTVFVTAILCVLIFSLIAPENPFDIYADIIEGIKFVTEAIGVWRAVTVVVLGLVAMLCFSLCTGVFAYYCITLGAVVAKKYKLLASIGIFYGFSALISILTEVGSVLLVQFAAAGVSEYLGNFTEHGFFLLAVLIMLGAIVVSLAVAQRFRIAILSKVENKLNLP